MKTTWKGALIALLVGTSPLSAQQPRMAVGILGGYSAGDVRTDDPELGTTSRRDAGAAGFFLEFRANDRISVRPNLLYQQQGFLTRDATTDATVALEYVTLPLLLQVHLLKEGRVRPRVFAGPSIGFEAVCTVTGTVDGEDDEFDCDEEEIDVATASTVYAAVFGAGVDVGTGRWLLGVEGRYDWGLTDLDVDPGPFELEARTYSILVSLGVAF
ncbi:MAG: porin family protein [Gemmatimonadota bacterium]|nr:PorT family protein [Gemmatimonadota bacterium]